MQETGSEAGVVGLGSLLSADDGFKGLVAHRLKEEMGSESHRFSCRST